MKCEYNLLSFVRPIDQLYSDKSLQGSSSVDTSTETADSLGFKYCTQSSNISLSASSAYLLVSSETSSGDKVQQ